MAKSYRGGNKFPRMAIQKIHFNQQLMIIDSVLRKKWQIIAVFYFRFCRCCRFYFQADKNLFLPANSKPNWYNNNNKRKGGN